MTDKDNTEIDSGTNSRRSCPTNEFPKPPRAFELVDHLEDITQSLSEATEVLIVCLYTENVEHFR